MARRSPGLQTRSTQSLLQEIVREKPRLKEGPVRVHEKPSCPAYTPGVQPHRSQYVRRNRIQTGLSLACVVVESPIKSGTMHTARFAHGQGRLLIAVLPRHEGSKLDRSGGDRLVADLGAQGVSGSRGLRELLEGVRSGETKVVGAGAVEGDGE